MQGSKVRQLILVDDHAVVRDGLRQVFSKERDFSVVAEAGSADDALTLCKERRPDGLVMDLTLGRANGLSLVAELRKRMPDVKILVLSMHDEIVFAERALRAGANGYVMKDQPSAVIVDALRRVLSGKTYVSEAVSERLFQTLGAGAMKRGRSGLESLSDREVEVLRQIGRGQQTKDIAQGLGISVKTVETHRARIKEKLALDTGRQLTVLAVNWLRDGYLDTRMLESEPDESSSSRSR